MDREIVSGFVGKFCSVVRLDNGRDICSKGVITKVGNSALILNFHGAVQAISLDSIKNIREEVNRCDDM